MYELRKAGEKTFYMDGPYNVGIYKLNETDVCLIDTGINDHTVQKLDELLIGTGWNPVLIINTHYHADHAGGNHYFQKKYGSRILACKTAAAFLDNFSLAPGFVYGGFAPDEMMNKFVLAEDSKAELITPEKLPEGLSYFHIDGHAPEMIGVRTDDDVYFLADGLVSEITLTLHHMSFLYDVKKYLQSLERIERLKGKLFIPSHAPAAENIRPLVQLNRQNVLDNINLILSICQQPKSTDEIITEIFEIYDLRTGFYQYVVNGAIIKSYLSYLLNEGRLEIVEAGKKICWKKVKI